MEKPRFEHDCSSCQFLGQFTYEPPREMRERMVDLYYCAGCEADMGGTILVRDGDAPHEYGSMPVCIIRGWLADERARKTFATLTEAYIEGLKRMEERR